jgi:signal transduction histidine kinase
MSIKSLSVPPHLQKYVENHKPGIYEIWDDALTAHAAVIPLYSSSKTLFVFYDVEAIESSEQLESMLKIILGITDLGVLVLGWALSRSLANRILTPVSKLASAVQALPLEKNGTTLNFKPAPDEVGTLARTIDQLLHRISEFTRREREFTAHASHELRTPVTVIKGAMEIMKDRIEKNHTAIQRPLARIERAVGDIEHLINTFLMLARKRQAPNQEGTCNLKEIVEKVVSEHRYLLATKPVDVEVFTKNAGVLKTPPSPVAIALGNLVRNAFQYTMDGNTEIIAFGNRVEICDNGPGIDTSRRGDGLGLTIVERLCEHMGWGFEITSLPGKGTRAELTFSHPDIPNPAHPNS